MDVNHLDSRVAPYYDADTCFRFALVAGPVEFIFDTGVCCDELAAGGMVTELLDTTDRQTRSVDFPDY